MLTQKIEEVKLFPTSIFQTKVPSYGIFNEEFKKYIYTLKSKHPESDSKSNQKGWHSPGLNINDEIITKFVNILDPMLESIANKLGWDLEQYFIGYKSIWSIINDKYSYNLVHSHGDALLALAYYVKIPKDNKGGNFYFTDPRITSAQRKPPMLYNKQHQLGKTHSAFNHVLDVKEGDLIIFPGWMDHGVKQSTSDDDRIVISANINLYPREDKIKPGFQPNYFSH
tara:strand:- start:399 stop:1076 length:678 start_codon:yes stop_codon:yes gene_type:complete